MKTYIIYLAAGNSRRFKEDKLHALFKGKELYLYGIDTLKQLLKYRNDIEIIIVSNTIDIFNQSSYSICSLMFKDRVGNPVIFSKDYFNELYSLKEDQGGRTIVNKYPQECFYFIIENEKELYDIDYQSDLQKLIKEEEYD